MNDETQVRHHEFTRRIEILLFAEAHGERLLVFLAQHLNRTNGLDVRIQTTDRTGQYEIVISRDYRCRHS